MPANKFKIEFKDYPSGSWIDWSEYLVNDLIISKKIESENPGEAGAVVFSDISITLRNEGDVQLKFSGDLTSVQRYLIKIGLLKSNGTYSTKFIGIVDFTTIEYDELKKTIKFRIVDKISALSFVYAEPSRSTYSIMDRILQQSPDPTYYLYHYYTNVLDTIWLSAAYPNVYDNLRDIVVNIGDLINIPEQNEPATKRFRVVIESKIEQPPGFSHYANKIRFSPPLNSSRYDQYTFDGTEISYDYLIYGINCNILSADTLIGIDGLEIIKSLYRQAWTGEPVTLIPVGLQYKLPVEYATMIINEQPLNKEPLEALKALIDSFKPQSNALAGAYLVANENGLTIIARNNLSDSGNLRSLASAIILNMREKYFWDKLCDGAKVTLKSWIRDNTTGKLKDFIGKASKSISGFEIKPRNEIKKDIIATTDYTGDPNIYYANAAQTIAQDYLNFYGKRRKKLLFDIYLDDNTLQWDILDRINYLGADYSIFEMTIKNDIISINAVEINGHDYDIRQVLLTSSDTNRIAESVSTEISIIGGGNSYTFDAPLSLNNSRVSLSISPNLKLTNYALNTVQDITTTSTPTFAQLSLTNPGNAINNAVRADRIIATSYPLNGGGNLTNNRTLSLLYSAPLTVTSNNLTLSYDTTNLKLTSNALNTIQDISTSSSPAFANLTINTNLTVNRGLILNRINYTTTGEDSVFYINYSQQNQSANLYRQNIASWYFTWNTGNKNPSWWIILLNSRMAFNHTSADETLNDVNGINNYADMQSSGNINYFTSFYSNIGGTGTGTITNGICFRGYINYTNMTVTNAYGLYLQNLKGNTVYGIRIQNIVASVNGWAIYSDSDVPSYFRGKIGINNNAPSYGLDVNGTGRFVNNLTLSAILDQQGTSGTNIFKADINQQGNKSILNNFTSGWTGSGWRLDYGVTGANRSTLEIDDLWVRGTLNVFELVINQIRATNGSLFVTSAARIEQVISGAQIKVEDPEGHNVAPFAVGDIVIVQRVRLDSTTLVKRLVRTVVTVSGTTLTLGTLADAPADLGSFAKGDTLVRIGNTSNSARQGSVYLTSDDSNAPYIDVANDVNNWTAWSGSNKLKLRLGKLTGITDALLGPLFGYGLYAKGGIYLSSNSTVAGILMTVDNASAKFEMRQGSNKIFEFDTATSTAKIAGAVFTNSAIYKLTSGTPSSNPVGGFVLDSTNNAFTIYKDIDSYVRMYYTSGANWGLKGISSASEIFSLGSSNKISGWTFDTSKLYNDVVSLEASASMKGLVVDTDKVKVGKFDGSNISNSYTNITSAILNGYSGIVSGDTAWAIIGKFYIGSNQYDPGLTLSNNYANTFINTECSSWNYRLTHRMFNHTTHVLGRKIKIGFKTHFTLGQEGYAYSGGRFTFAIRYYDSGWGTAYFLTIYEENIEDSLGGTYTIDKTGSNAIEVTLPANIPSTATVYAEWIFSGGGQTGTYYPYDMDLSDLTFNGYVGYKTWINEKGLQLYNSDINYIKLFDTDVEINVPIIKMRGKPLVRFHGRLGAPPTGDVEIGDMYIRTSDNKTYQCYTINNSGEPQWTALN